MLDKDLAMLYGVEVKVLNQAVKRNIERFPNDFRFQLTKEECLRSQIVTLNEKQGQHLKYMPYAFTEQGVAMPNTHQLRWKHSVYHTTASFALMMTYIISELPLKTWAKNGSVSQRWKC